MTIYHRADGSGPASGPHTEYCRRIRRLAGGGPCACPDTRVHLHPGVPQGSPHGTTGKRRP